MKIVVAGAGAMGSRFAIMLQKGGHDVILVDGWKEHIEAIQQDGLKAEFNGENITAHFPIYHQNDVNKEERPDLIILLTKAMQLEKMLQCIQCLMKDDTKVLCLLNGIGHDEVMEKYISKHNMYLGNTMWTAGLKKAGEAILFGNGSVELQNLEKGQEEGAKELVELLSASGLHAKYSDNIYYSIYRKACVNGTMNGLCTVLDVNMAGLGLTSSANDMIETIVKEFASVAEKEGVYLDIAEVISHVKTCFNAETIGMHYPSMHQDLIKNHRLTEIDYINGAVSRKGRKYGVLTPYCDFLTQLVHAKEQILEAK